MVRSLMDLYDGPSTLNEPSGDVDLEDREEVFTEYEWNEEEQRVVAIRPAPAEFVDISFVTNPVDPAAFIANTATLTTIPGDTTALATANTVRRIEEPGNMIELDGGDSGWNIRIDNNGQVHLHGIEVDEAAAQFWNRVQELANQGQ